MQLACVGLSIAIGVNPHSEVCERGIVLIDDAIVVAVEGSKIRKAVATRRPKQFVGDYGAVMLPVVENEKTFAAGGPTGVS
jgi:hypothetical protein